MLRIAIIIPVAARRHKRLTPDLPPRRCLTLPASRLMDEYQEAGYERTNKGTAECRGLVRSLPPPQPRPPLGPRMLHRPQMVTSKSYMTLFGAANGSV